MVKIGNGDIKQELRVKAVTKRSEDNQLKWFGHLYQEYQIKDQIISEATVKPDRTRERSSKT